MATYISILRGINVSGHKLIKMDALRKSYESLGFRNVKSYLQSGNIVFDVDKNNLNQLEEEIIQLIEKDFGFQVPVIVLTIDKLNFIINNNPFLKDSSKELSYLHVTFLSKKPISFNLEVIEEKKGEDEEIIISENVVYLYCPNGYGNTKLTNNLFESKLKVVATTRNWKTTNELLILAQQISK